jgi:hypothetical protein
MHAVTVNRAPVLTLWCAVVAEHLGFERDEVRKAMMQLATAREPERLASEAYALYEEFRPDGPAGKKSGRGGRAEPRYHPRARRKAWCCPLMELF